MTLNFGPHLLVKSLVYTSSNLIAASVSSAFDASLLSPSGSSFLVGPVSTSTTLRSPMSKGASRPEAAVLAPGATRRLLGSGDQTSSSRSSAKIESRCPLLLTMMACLLDPTGADLIEFEVVVVGLETWEEEDSNEAAISVSRIGSVCTRRLFWHDEPLKGFG